MKNHFEAVGLGGIDKFKQKENREENQLFQKVKEQLQLTAKGNFNERAQRFIADFIKETGKDEDKVRKMIFDKLIEDQGTLPEIFQEEYISLAYSQGAIESMMLADADLGFYEAVGKIGKELKMKGVNLDERLVNAAIKEAEAEVIE